MKELATVFLPQCAALLGAVSMCLSADLNTTTNQVSDLGAVQVLLSKELGGHWEIKNQRLHGVKTGSESNFLFACTIIPNPKNSEDGRLQAQAVGYYWSSHQSVFAASPGLLLFANSTSATNAMARIAELLKAGSIAPPLEFRTFVERNCDCRWNDKEMRLERVPNKASEPSVAPAPQVQR